MQQKFLGIFGGTLLIAGTTIGAGMLALPVATAPAGFFPSLLLLVITWMFMSTTGIIFARFCCFEKRPVNILSMAERTYGQLGRICTWVLYIFLFYCLLVAYLLKGSSLFGDLLGINHHHYFQILLFAAVFISLIGIGKKAVDPINRLLIGGLFIAYFGFVFIGITEVKCINLCSMHWPSAMAALPFIFASFGYQATVPTLSEWMGFQEKNVIKAILFGTAIALIIYVVWQFLLFGIVPQYGSHGLIETLNAGQDAIYPLHAWTKTPLILFFGKLFAICALTTSFLGVGIGLVNFIEDGLKIKIKEPVKHFGFTWLIFIIPLLCTVIYPNIFLQALGLAGGIGCALLLGAFPLLMILRAKKKKLKHFDGSLLTNRIFLSGMLIFVIFEVCLELYLVFIR